MTDRRQTEIELELAEMVLRDLQGQEPNRGEYGWVTNRRASIYAAEAEIARLNKLLRKDPSP